jgi:hypothetical protein
MNINYSESEMRQRLVDLARRNGYQESNLSEFVKVKDWRNNIHGTCMNCGCHQFTPDDLRDGYCPVCKELAVWSSLELYLCTK